MSLDTIRMSVPHVVRGRVYEPTPDNHTEYKDFATPELDLDELIWPRNEPGPGAFMHEQRMFEFPTRLGAR